MKILVWPEGSWCWENELEEMSHLSDDYYAVELPEWADDDDADRIATMQGRDPDVARYFGL